MTTSFFVQQSHHSRYVSAQRLATHLMLRYDIDADGLELAVKLFPVEIHDNDQAITSWVISTLEAPETQENENIVEELCEKFEVLLSNQLGRPMDDSHLPPENYDEY